MKSKGMEEKNQTGKKIPSLGITVLHHSAEPRDAKTVTLGTKFSIRTSHLCKILVIWFARKKHLSSRVPSNQGPVVQN